MWTSVRTFSNKFRIQKDALRYAYADVYRDMASCRTRPGIKRIEMVESLLYSYKYKIHFCFTCHHKNVRIPNFSKANSKQIQEKKINH